MIRTTTAQQVYTLTELLAMTPETLRRLMQGLGVRLRADVIEKIDLIRALANSGRIIVSTDGASPEDVAELQRQLSSANGMPTTTMNVDDDDGREPKLQRTQAASAPTGRGSGTPQYTRLELEGMRISQLKELLASRHIPLDGLLEKKDLIDRLLE
jgi:hypothetical protein